MLKGYTRHKVSKLYTVDPKGPEVEGFRVRSGTKTVAFFPGEVYMPMPVEPAAQADFWKGMQFRIDGSKGRVLKGGHAALASYSKHQAETVRGFVRSNPEAVVDTKHLQELFDGLGWAPGRSLEAPARVVDEADLLAIMSNPDLTNEQRTAEIARVTGITVRASE